MQQHSVPRKAAKQTDFVSLAEALASVRKYRAEFEARHPILTGLVGEWRGVRRAFLKRGILFVLSSARSYDRFAAVNSLSILDIL
jgi:hypothetical protein